MPRKRITDLPASSDKEFWGEAEIIQSKDEENQHFDLIKEGHQWRQQGPFIICKSCPLEHSYRIGMKRQLHMIDGELKLKKVDY